MSRFDRRNCGRPLLVHDLTIGSPRSLHLIGLGDGHSPVAIVTQWLLSEHLGQSAAEAVQALWHRREAILAVQELLLERLLKARISQLLFVEHIRAVSIVLVESGRCILAWLFVLPQLTWSAPRVAASVDIDLRDVW